MANFGKFANLSPAGWTTATTTQAIAVGQNAHIGLWGEGPKGEDLLVKALNPLICVVHEEPRPKAWPRWRHFLLTALQDGDTRINATLASGTVWASMTVQVSGHTGVRLVFFPGEQTAGALIEGTIYVIGGAGERMIAAGGPAVPRKDRGGHTAEPTPPGNYILGKREHVVTSSWPKSVIPWGANLHINSAGDVEFEVAPGKWKLATGLHGLVTHAAITFLAKDKKHLTAAALETSLRLYFIDPKTHKLWRSTWNQNDFGRWGWNLTQHGKRTAYFVHTTAEDEQTTDEGKAVFLTNSHGCIHLVPSERERLEKAGYLQEGIHFEVRPYKEKGTP